MIIRRMGKKILSCCALILSAALLSCASVMVPGFAQWYSVNIYPVLQGSIGRLAGMMPFSLSEMLCCAVPVILAIDVIDSVIRYKKHDPADEDLSVHPAVRTAGHLIVTASILILMYSACCGVNYYRDPFVDDSSFRSAQFTVQDLDDFCSCTVDVLRDIYSEEYTEYPEGRALADDAVRAMKDLAMSAGSQGPGDIAALEGFYPKPKKLTVLSGLFSKMGVSGIYSPFTIEANVNGEMEGMEQPFTACHELSHLRGFMNEGEANYIGWLACINSENRAFNRSGWLMAWVYAGNSLYRADPERYYELRSRLPSQALKELDENNEFWASRKTRASEVQDRVNDAYLKSRGQEDGIRTYGQVTTLMLMWYSENC